MSEGQRTCQRQAEKHEEHEEHLDLNLRSVWIRLNNHLTLKYANSW